MYESGGFAMGFGNRVNSCANCAAKDQVIAELARQLAEARRPVASAGPLDPLATCPCRVENGGSGVCGCVRGSQILCAVV